MKKLGIDEAALDKKCSDPGFYRSLGLGAGVYFDQETFAADRLVSGLPAAEENPSGGASSTKLEEFLSRGPLSDAGCRDILRVEPAEIDYLPCLTAAGKEDRPLRVSYK